MTDEQIGAALVELADLLVCISNDFHNLHFNYRGTEFDIMHKKTLQKYYDKSGDDYDEIYEAAMMFTKVVPPVNEASTRINYPNKDFGEVGRQQAVTASMELLNLICTYYYKCFCLLNDIKEVRCIGVSNLLQDRIQYWSKELYYFNRGRIE